MGWNHRGKGRGLLGWRRDCWTAASAAAMAIPASSRWACVTLLLLWLRDGPWERSWPSEEDLELPGLLWDFSRGLICMSERGGGEEGRGEWGGGGGTWDKISVFKLREKEKHATRAAVFPIGTQVT